MHKARFWETAGEKVRCTLCPHSCIIPEGRFGMCRARKNISGKLFTLTYGDPVAAGIDPVEKKPLFHFLPGTTSYSIGTYGCNMGCMHCQNFEISQHHAAGNNNISPEDIVKTAIEAGCTSISYTYNEPTVFFEYACDIAAIARKKGLKNILVTNGFTAPAPAKRFSEIMDAANVDIKAWDDSFYRDICKATLEPVKKTLKIYKKAGMWIEITNLIIDRKNDDMKKIQEMCRWIKKELGSSVPLHFSRAFPMYKIQDIVPTPMRTLEHAKEIASEYLDYVYTGNTGTGQDTICPKCKELLIRRRRYGSKVIRTTCSCKHHLEGVFD